MTDNTNTDADDTSGLKAKNAELLGKLKTADASNKALESRLNSLEDAQNDALDTTKSEADKTQAKLQRQIDKLTGDLTARDTRLGELLIDNAIKEAITTNKVLPQYAKAVEAMLRAGAKIENGEAFGADGSPLTDANAAFFKSADAKHFVSAPDNAGAGAAGNTAPTAGKWAKPPTPAEMTQWGFDAVTDRDFYNAKAREWNRPDLEV